MIKIAYMDKKNSYKEKLSNELLKSKDDFGKGIIIETGAGNALYNILCTFPNTASKLVKYAFSPTEWQYTKDIYFLNDKSRAVCLNTVSKILDIEIDKNNDKNIKWYFINSVQISNDEKTQTHGWIAYKYEYNYKYYHFTINNNNSAYKRKDLLNIIEQIFLDVFLSKNINDITSGYIDKIVDFNHKDLEIDVFNNIFNPELAISHSDDTYICSIDNTLCRFNDMIRHIKSLNKEIVIFKGSFNPIHIQHYNMYKKMLEMNKYCIFMISINNRDLSKHIAIDNLLKRIEILKRLNIPFIINRKGMYSDCINHLSNHFELKDIKLSFLLGDDIMQRLIDDNDLNSENFKGYESIKFYTTQRILNNKINDNRYNIEYLNIDTSEISSSDIRKEFEKNNNNEIDHNKLCDIYKENKNILEIIKEVYGKN